MADDIRIKDLQSTASYMESDDYLPIDSLALGNRKIPFTGLMDSEDDRLPTTDKTPRGAIAEHEDDISEIKQSLSDLTTLTKTASGTIVTFDDGSDLPMPKLEVAIEPQQDLHGYDHPWVGGAGKNKLGASSYGGNYGKVVGDDLKTGTAQSYSITTNGTITVESVASWSGVLFVTPPLEAGSYSIPAQEISVPSGSNPRCSVYITDSNLIVKSAVSYKQYAGNYPQTDITVESGDRIAYGVSNSVANSSTTITNFYVTKTSDLPSGYSPYSNICPISGWDEAVVTVSPLNISQLYNGQIYGDGSWVSSNMRLTNVSEAQDNSYFLKAGTYTLDYDKLNSNAPNLLQCAALTKDGNYTIIDNFANKWSSVPFTFTLTQDGYFYFTIRKNADTNINPSDYRAKILGQTYTIDLDGTCYGGTLDVVSGVLTITDGYIASYNGETLPSTWISDRDVYAEGTTPTVGAEVVYKLATPQTIQLTPTQVNSLLGVNNIWADTGNINELVYMLDNIISRATSYLTQSEPIHIGYKQGKKLYRQYLHYSNITIATNTDITLTSVSIPNGADNISVSDKSYVQSGTLRLNANCGHSNVYSNARTIIWRQSWSSSATWELHIWVEYTLPN